MNGLEGANCADLAGFVIDKYFDSDAHKQPFLARTAMAICSHCVVLEECRDQALTMPNPQTRGIIGGVNANELARARAWRTYELGYSDKPPRRPRPDWLTRSDAAETTEQAWTEGDPDER